MADLGALFYQGPSLFTGEPIVGIVTGLDGGSMNPKTGPIVQAWVIRPDLPPMDAKRANIDDAVCGDCQLRGHEGFESGCYVPAWMGPNNVYKAYRRGHYLASSWPDLHALLEGQMVRMTAYGDPGAVPFEIWQALVRTAASWIGYTHAAHRCDPRLKTMVMASCDSEAERVRFAAEGWRTFRIRTTKRDAVLPGEFICPASDEAGHRVTCAKCRLCRGTSSPARSVAIIAHGKPSSLRVFRKVSNAGLPLS